MMNQVIENIKQFFHKGDLWNATKHASQLLKSIESDIASKKLEIHNLHQTYLDKEQELSTQLPKVQERLLKAEGTEAALMGQLKFELLSKFEQFEESHLIDLHTLYQQLNELEISKASIIDTQLQAYGGYLGNTDRVQLKYQDYMQHSLGRDRSSMPQVNADDIDKFLIHFARTVKINPCQMKLSEIKPSQGEMDDRKILDKMTNDDWKHRKYLISKDNYLIDGHHSWASGLEHNPDQMVDCYKVNLTAKELLRRTNLMKITRKEDLQGNTITKAVFEGLSEVEVGAFCKAFDQYLMIRENEIEQLRADEMWQNISQILSPSLKAYNQSIEHIFKR